MHKWYDGQTPQCPGCGWFVTETWEDGKEGIIETKGMRSSYTYWPVMRSTVLSDASLPIAAPKDENPLSRFTDRELYEELKSRGVAWDRMWKKVYIEYSKI